MTKSETCQNPWNPNCTNTDIVLYIRYKKHKLPICRDCWDNQLADSDHEWGEDEE